MFNISRDTIDRWLKRRNEGVKAASGYQRGHSHRIKDWDAFRAFANFTVTRPKARWFNFGRASSVSARSLLAHIGWTRKKRRTATEMKTNAPLS